MQLITGRRHPLHTHTAAGNLLVIFLVIEAVLFGLFTCCMMLDQYTVVSTNTTAIDRLKGEYHQVVASHRHDVNEVFGGKDGRFRLDWFLPVPAAFPSSIASDLLGYRTHTHEEELEEGRRAQGDEEEGILMLDRGDGVRGGPVSSGGTISAVSRERLRGVVLGTGGAGAEEKPAAATV